MWSPWRRQHRSVEEILAQARAREAAEHLAAVERILRQATTHLPVIAPRTAPLMTPGQAARSSRRWQQ